MHVIDTAPWTDWLRIATSLLQSLIFLTTITVIVLGATSSAVIERQWDLPYLEQTGQTPLPQTSYTSTHEMKVRIQLVCFYMLAPLIMVALIVGEAWCLFTNELAPLYVVVASILAIFVWALEIGFWTACHTKSGDAVSDLCPVIFQHGKDDLFKISGLDFAEASVYLAAVLIVLYLAYMALGATVYHRERVRDEQRKWIGAQKRASLLRFASDEESEKANAQEGSPMIQSRASLAQARGDRTKRVTWE